MTKECQISKKETNKKYTKIPRKAQAEILQKVENGQSQQSVAKEYGIPRSTLRAWRDRATELRGKADPEMVAFFESKAGVAFLHELLVGIILIFHKLGGCGLPIIKTFLDYTNLSLFVGSSVGSLHKLSQQADKLLDEYGTSEQTRLQKDMPKKKVTGCLDETFFGDRMILVWMDARSGFIAAEEEEKSRDALTWERVGKKGLGGLNVEVIQVTGDKAGGITSYATKILGVHKSPDLFHIQQDITKGLTAHLGRKVAQAETSLQENQESKKRHLEQFQENIRREDASLDDVSITKNAKKILEIGAKEKHLQECLEKAKEEQKEAQVSRRIITEKYHPFDLETGQARTPKSLEEDLKKAYDSLEEISKKAGCTDKQQKKLSKARAMISDMVQTLNFFWNITKCFIDNLQLTQEESILFEQFFLPIEYLMIVERRCGKKEKGKAQKSRKKLEEELAKRTGTLSEYDQKKHKELRKKARECAEFFQRSSSCVEGHNAVLSQRHHSSRNLSIEQLRSIVVLHNYFIKRKDGTTAAERFFGQKPIDLFIWLLERMSYPVRPRKKYAKIIEMQAA